MLGPPTPRHGPSAHFHGFHDSENKHTAHVHDDYNRPQLTGTHQTEIWQQLQEQLEIPNVTTGPNVWMFIKSSLLDFGHQEHKVVDFGNMACGWVYPLAILVHVYVKQFKCKKAVELGQRTNSLEVKSYQLDFFLNLDRDI